ncbi:malignant fibrous histiocytoma-amplified sequence 1-like, partial [Scleropages formosus]
LKNDRKVDLSGKKLKVIQWEDLAPTENIGILDLQRNKLKDVMVISRLSCLRELNLTRNQIVEFPKELKELHHLEKLYLSQNNIRSIPEGVFSCLSKLSFLRLNTNRLVELPSDVCQCQNLRYVNLSNNYLNDLNVLVGLPRLEELYVDNNRLLELPGELFLNTDLRMIKASGNHLRKPPAEVCAGGVKSIQHYLKMLGDNPLCERRVKTMFLGSTMAGKSTLCRSLIEGDSVQVDANDRTVGIEISELDQEGVRFLLWDFAGHEEYYFTHHVFITPCALVVLVIDLARYSIEDPQSFRDNVSFWIRNIQLRVPESVVLPVGTHTDKCRDPAEVREKKKDIERRINDLLEEGKEALKQREKNIREEKDPELFSNQLNTLQQLASLKLRVLELITINSTEPREIALLKMHILHQVQEKDVFPNIERTLPSSYQEVESLIQSLLKEEDIPEHGIVSLDELLSELKQKLVKLDAEDLKFILHYLHLFGIVVWYKDIPALEDTVFVKPSFLITLFKSIVRHDLEKELQDIPKHLLQKERSFAKDKNEWIDEFKSKATLQNAAIRVLVRKSLQTLQLDQEDFVEEITGTRKKNGKMLTLLQHFEVCLPSLVSNPLNPQAQVFNPERPREWKPSEISRNLEDGACLFPGFLENNKIVQKMWGNDKNDDITVHVYFLPDVPHGFFHRLIIKACSYFSTQWVGKDQCLIGYSQKLVLFKEICGDEDQYIEIRCRRPETNETQQSWDMILVVLRKLLQLTTQWPGLYACVCSPCKENGCSADFKWGDWQDASFSNIYKEYVMA